MEVDGEGAVVMMGGGGCLLVMMGVRASLKGEFASQKVTRQTHTEKCWDCE